MNVFLLDRRLFSNKEYFRFLSKSMPDGYYGVVVYYGKTLRMEKIEVAQMEFLERIEGRTQNLKRNLYVVSAYYAPVRSTEE